MLLEASVNPVFFEINAENVIWTLIQKITKVHEVFDSVPTPFCAPSVAMYAGALCFTFGFKSICLLGQDLASDGRSIYTNGASKYLQPTSDVSAFKIPVPGFWGGTVYTREDFEFYLEQYTLLTDQWKTLRPEISLVNATEGGAFIEGFKHLEFKSHIGNVLKSGPHEEKHIEFKSSKDQQRSKLDRFMYTTKHTLQAISKIADEIIRIDSNDTLNSANQKKKKCDGC